MSELVTATEFARRVGVSQQRVSQLVADGKLPTVPAARNRRKIPWAEGKATWDAERGITPAADPQPGADPLAPPAQPKPDAEAPYRATVAERFAKARADDKAHQAEIRRLHMEELKGTLVRLADVKAEARELGTRIRVAIQAIPARVAPMLEGRTVHEIEAILDTATTEALQALSEGKFASPQPP